jgi:hypothetical protein
MLNTLPEELYTNVLHKGCIISAFHTTRAWDKRSRAGLNDPFTIARLLIRGANEEEANPHGSDLMGQDWYNEKAFGECLQRFLHHSSLPDIIRHLINHAPDVKQLFLCAATLLKRRNDLSDDSVRNCREGYGLIIEHLSILDEELYGSSSDVSSNASSSDASSSDGSSSDASSLNGSSSEQENEEVIPREIVNALGRLHRVWEEAVLPYGDVPAFSTWCENFERISLCAVPWQYLRIDHYLCHGSSHSLQSHIFRNPQAIRSEKTVFLVLMSGNKELLEGYKEVSGDQDFETLIRSNLTRRSNWSHWNRGLTRKWGCKEVVEIIGQAALHIPKKQLPYVRNFADVHRRLSDIGYNFGTTEAEIALILESKELFDGGVRALEKFQDLRVVFRAVLGDTYLLGEYAMNSDLTIPVLLEALFEFGHKALDFPVSRRNRYDFIAYADACDDERQRERLREGLIDLVVDTK